MSRTIDERQLEALSALYRQTAAIGDGLGSENTDFGQVIVTPSRTLEAACRQFFPESYLVVPSSRAAFEEEFGSVPGVPELVASVSAYEPEWALVGHPESFRPEGGDRGSFWICVFLRGEQDLACNALLRFQRTET